MLVTIMIPLRQRLAPLTLLSLTLLVSNAIYFLNHTNTNGNRQVHHKRGMCFYIYLIHFLFYVCLPLMVSINAKKQHKLTEL